MYSITFSWVSKALNESSKDIPLPVEYENWGNKWIMNLLLNKQKLKRNEYN